MKKKIVFIFLGILLFLFILMLVIGSWPIDYCEGVENEYYLQICADFENIEKEPLYIKSIFIITGGPNKLSKTFKLGKQALLKQDPTLCNQIDFKLLYQDLYHFCLAPLYSQQIQINNSKFCDKLSNNEISPMRLKDKDNCYQLFARKLNDTSLCDKITNLHLQEICKKR